MSDCARGAVERLLSLVASELGEDLIGVWLYAPRARGEQAGPRSDIDLLIITSRGCERDFWPVTELAMDAAEAEGVDPFRVSTRVADPGWIEGRREIESFFMREVDRDKIALAAGRESALRGAARECAGVACDRGGRARAGVPVARRRRRKAGRP